MKWTTAILTGAAIAAAACTDGAITKPPAPVPPPPPGSLVILSERDTTLTADTLAVGGNVWLRVSGVDTAAAVDWTVNDTGVAQVLERHKARVHLNAHKTGGATIGASLEGRTGTFALVVQPQSATNHPPVARIQGPTSTSEGTAVTFDGRSSRDPDHDGLTYLWSFGDGTARDTASAATHTYADNGARTVTLIVTDPRGSADTATVSVAVKNAPPVISALQVPSASVHLGDSVKVTATVSDPGSADVLTITIDWGDGKTSSGTDVHEAHLYSAAGTYSVTATVRDDDGDSASRMASVSVSKAVAINGYEAIDLGTLGGNSATTKDINDFGQIVGSSLTASGAQHAFVWENGSMRDINIAGYEGSDAQRVNNAGVIAGIVWTGPDAECSHNWGTGVVWRNGTGTVLSSRSGTGHAVTAVAIDEAADVVWDACGHESHYAYLSQGDHWQSLGGVFGSFPDVSASGMNERPQIVGWNGAVYGGDSPYPTPHAFLWENGSMRDLGTLGFKPCSATANNCAWSRATSINENGQVAGFSMDAAGAWHAVLWDNAGVHDLGTMTYDGQGAVINDGGQIAASSGGEGFFWSAGTRYPLGSLGGGQVHVVDMNEAGEVAGTSMTTSGEQHAFVWTRDHGMVDLGTGPDGLTAAWVVGISFHGDIAGNTAPCNLRNGSCYPSTQTRAVLWRKSQ